MAFSIVFIGFVITSFPDKSISIHIAKFLAWIFVFIGQIKLINLLSGRGRIGAILFLSGSLLQIVARVTGLLNFTVNDFFNMVTPDVIGVFNSMNSLLSGGGGASTDLFGSLLQESEYSSPGPAWISILQNISFVGAMIMWLTYPPLKKAKPGIIILLVVYALLFLTGIPEMLHGNIPAKGFLTGISAMITMIAFYKIAVKIPNTEQERTLLQRYFYLPPDLCTHSSR